MRGILLFLVLGYWLIAQDQKQPIHIAPYLIESPESSLDSPNAKESISANELEQKAKKKFPLYQPIDIRKNSYGAFFIGYSYNQISSDSICLQNGENTFYRSANGVFFGLERGWQKKNFMLGGYLNGVAADDYSLSLGIRASYLIAKYIIPSKKF